MQLSPAAPEVTSRRCPRQLNCWPRVRLDLSHGRRGAMSQWGPASRSPIPGIADPGPLAPPPTEAPPGFRYHRRALARSLRAFLLALRHVRNFPSNRAGILNPGDDSLPYNSNYTAVSRTVAVRRGSSVEMLFPAASPQPQHRGPSSRGTTPPCLPPERMAISKLLWRRRQPLVRLLHSVRDLSPPPH